MFIPVSLARDRQAGLLGGLVDPKANLVLHRSWQKTGEHLPKEQQMLPIGLQVTHFRHQQFVCLVIVFPPPLAVGESYFGFIGAGPVEDWSPETRAKVPVRYFLLERSTATQCTVFEWQPSPTKGEELFEDVGTGPIPENPKDPRTFIDVILSNFYR